MSLKSAAKRIACPPGTTTLLALATLTLLSACRSGDEAPAAEVRPVRVMTIETRAIGDTVALTGTVQAQTEINQSFRIDGRLIERTVDIGDTVRPGQLIARLDPAERGKRPAGGAGAAGRGARRSWWRRATTTRACATWWPRTPCRAPRSTRRDALLQTAESQVEVGAARASTWRRTA